MEDIPIGDNFEKVETDYELSDFGDIMEMIKQMPKLDNEIIHYSQYTNKRYFTGCTIMHAINIVSTITNYRFSDADIASVYDKAEIMGWKPGSSWARGTGLNCVRNRWNERNKDNQMLTFLIDIGSEEFDMIMDRMGIVSVSIRADAQYRKDARDNLKLDSDKYGTSGGHATTMMPAYICVDSVPQNTAKDNKTPMIYNYGEKERIENLIKNGNMRRDCHCVLFSKWLKGDSERLNKMLENLNKAIEANSAIWELTNDPKEKAKRNEMNTYNRAKKKIVESML